MRSVIRASALFTSLDRVRVRMQTAIRAIPQDSESGLISICTDERANRGALERPDIVCIS